MENFVLFEGGTGSKVATALSHLIASGMIEKQDEIIHLQLCDKDGENKDTADAKGVIESVVSLTGIGTLDPVDGNGLFDRKVCFTTRVLKDDFDFTKRLEEAISKSGGGNAANEPVPSWIVDNRYRDLDKFLLDAFFSKEDQAKALTDGFIGSATRGALVYAYLLEKDKSIVDKIREYLNHNADKHCRVFVVGSIFGGTGASMFLKTVEVVKALDPARVHVAGVLVLPYFTFIGEDGCTINPDKFWKKTMTSLEGYEEYGKLVKTYPGDTGKLLDRLYFAESPNHELHYCTMKAVNGGGSQMRKADFVDVVAANYIVDFFNANPDDKTGGYSLGTVDNKCSNIFALRYPDTINAEYPLKLSCIDGLENKFAAMLAFSATIFWLYHEYIVAEKKKSVDWIKDLFGKRKREEDSIKAAVEAVMKPVYSYCCKFVDFVKDLSENGKPCNPEKVGVKDFSENYCFFDTTCINALYRFKEAINSGEHIKESSIIDVINYNNFCCGQEHKSAMVTLQNVKTKKVINDATSFDDAIKAYINALYDYILN